MMANPSEVNMTTYVACIDPKPNTRLDITSFLWDDFWRLVKEQEAPTVDDCWFWVWAKSHNNAFAVYAREKWKQILENGV
jgi:hypothetical protein